MRGKGEQLSILNWYNRKATIMKKVILTLSLMAIILGFAGLDLWYTNRHYTKTHDNLVELSHSITEHSDNVANPNTIYLAKKTNDEWESGKKYLMMLVNHNVIRLVDEKMVSLLEQVESNNYLDATVSAKGLISYVKDLREENYPLLRNIL